MTVLPMATSGGCNSVRTSPRATRRFRSPIPTVTLLNLTATYDAQYENLPLASLSAAISSQPIASLSLPPPKDSWREARPTGLMGSARPQTPRRSPRQALGRN